MSKENNSKLSIVIPTYNRCGLLDICLRYHIELARKHDIAIYVSDNCSTDKTYLIIRKWMKRYPYLYYSKNSDNLGAETNFINSLKTPDSEYVWLLGDTYKIPEKGISRILERKGEDFSPDLWVFNLAGRLRIIPSKIYSNKNEVLTELAGIMSCLSCLVFSSSVINCIDSSRYIGSQFAHLGICMEFIGFHDFKLYWDQDNSIETIDVNTQIKDAWYNGPRSFDIGYIAWINFITSLPHTFDFKSKRKAFYLFGEASGLSKLSKFVDLRIHGNFNIRIFWKYLYYFRIMNHDNPLPILLVAMTPVSFFKGLRRVYRFFLKDSFFIR